MSATEEPASSEMAALLASAAEAEARGDLAFANDCFFRAVALDRANRAAFTGLERVLFAEARWEEARSFYQATIDQVEHHGLKAFRLVDLYLRRGQLELLHLHEPEVARATLLRALEIDARPDAIQAAFEKIYAASSDWNALLRVYDRRAELLTDELKRAEVFRRAARIAAVKLKDVGRAAAYYEAIYRINPADAECLDGLERSYEQRQDWQRLIDIVLTRLQLVSSGHEALPLYMRLGHVYEEGLRAVDQALESYRKAAEVDPRHRLALEAMARLYEGTERWTEFVATMRTLTELSTDRPQKALGYFKLGSVLESKFGKEEEAIACYESAITISSACLPAVHGLRDLYLRRQEWEKVVRTLELEAKLWTKEKERAGVLAHIAEVTGEKLGQPERAIEYYQAALAIDSNCLTANRALFDLYFSRGDFAAAAPLGAPLVSKMGREGDAEDRSEFFRRRAVVAAATGESRTAAESLLVALEVRPENESALDLFVEICKRAPEAFDFAPTLDALEKLYRKRQLDRALGRVLSARGFLAMRRHDLDDAAALYRQANELLVDDFPLLLGEVELYESLRRPHEAVLVLERFIAHSSDPRLVAQARLRLATLFSSALYDSERAVSTLRRYLETTPDDADAWFQLGTELGLTDRFSEAIAAVERSLALCSDDLSRARSYDTLGRLHERCGQPEKAEAFYFDALRCRPTSPGATIALARLEVARGEVKQALARMETALSASDRHDELTLLAAKADLQRGAGDSVGELETYRQLVACDGAGSDQRLLCAEALAARSRWDEAEAELDCVLRYDACHALALDRLMEVQARRGRGLRARRIEIVLEQLGYCSPNEQHGVALPRGLSGSALENLFAEVRTAPQWGLLQAIANELDQELVMPTAAELPPPRLKVFALEAQRLFSLAAEVLVGEIAVPVLVAPQQLWISPALMTAPDSEVRFWLGRALAFEIMGLGRFARQPPAGQPATAELLTDLLRPDAARSATTKALVERLGRKRRLIAKWEAAVAPSAEVWLESVVRAGHRSGLYACGDLGAAAWRAVESADGSRRPVVAATGRPILRTPPVLDLIRFFLSTEYDEMALA